MNGFSVSSRTTVASRRVPSRSASGVLPAPLWRWTAMCRNCTAARDLFARQQNVPLCRVLGGTRERIASGVSIGIQNSLDELAAHVERELAAGYRRIKIKIKPGWDVNAVALVRERFGSVPLMV